MPKFELVSDYAPRGDQPQAIEKLTEGLQKGYKYQTLLGVTGSGKSVAGSTPVVVFTQEENGKKRENIIRIGEFIDRKIEDDCNGISQNYFSVSTCLTLEIHGRLEGWKESAPCLRRDKLRHCAKPSRESGPENRGKEGAKRQNGPLSPIPFPLSEGGAEETLISYSSKPYQHYVLSLNLGTCETEIKPITAFIRHEAPEKLYHIRTACGREITVTGDHNLWVLRDGILKLLPTEEIAKTDYIPIPSKNRESEWAEIDKIEIVQSEEQYVYDFSVADNETFLAGTNGGMFVHNTFTMANIIANVQRPTLVVSHNKTLAAQLYSEFRGFFPHNAVHYFVSFYDWYRPEAYKPQTDTYIEKDVRINEEIDRLRLASTTSLMSRRDVIIVASVSCIYGIGSPEEYEAQRVQLKVGGIIKRRDILRALVDIRYRRNDAVRERGCFRARGDVIEIFPAYGDTIYRVELFGDEIDRITEINTLTGEIVAEHEDIAIYPARHFMTDDERFDQALLEIESELQERIDYFVSQNKLLEAQRIEQRTRFDLEMLREANFCLGIENYSRHFSGLKEGEPPYCLMNYYPDDYLLFIDESHVTIPQVRGMYLGDRSRKQTLVDYGFRLPSALDNRPLRYDEFEKVINQAIFVSATPAEFERELSRKDGQIVEQIIRPTGLIDPQIRVHPIEGQIDHLIGEINKRAAKNQRVLVLTMTKRMSEDLTDYLQDAGIRVNYLHSDIETLERPQILKELREAKYDVLVGINLLREGLDLPEVTLVAILDADRHGFLRTETALIQMAGRAARNIDGEVILYASEHTGTIRNVIEETARRRQIQMEYNEQHGITPASIQKVIVDMIREAESEKSETPPIVEISSEISKEALREVIDSLSQEMQEAAANLEFERAAALRDQIMELKKTEHVKTGKRENETEIGRGME